MKNKIISTAITVIVGLGSFYSGIYYGTLKLDQFVDKLSIDYDSIKKDVDTFIEVSILKLLDDILKSWIRY